MKPTDPDGKVNEEVSKKGDAIKKAEAEVEKAAYEDAMLSKKEKAKKLKAKNAAIGKLLD